jgi:hypothetical protein
MAANLPTPIPIGSPHVAHPPHFDRWTTRTHRFEQRDYARRAVAYELFLIDPESEAVCRSRTQNVSDAGVFAMAPIGFGLAIGQRYEIRMAVGEGDSFITGGIRSLGYGTVIRSEMRVGRDHPDQIGVAIRFDVPQLLPLRQGTDHGRADIT